MNLQTMLDQRNMTKYRLSQISGVPKTTVIDICSGKSELGNCSAKTLYQLSKALNCSMEDLMMLDSKADYTAGKPTNRSYLERGLPPYLQKSLRDMQASWKIVDSGKKDYMWDVYWCDLNASINSAEVDQEITHEQADYLRKQCLWILPTCRTDRNAMRAQTEVSCRLFWTESSIC